MWTIRLSIIGLMVYLISACSSPLNITTDYDDTVNFSQLKKYAWHAHNEHNHASKKYLNNELVDKRIRLNIEQQLAEKGFVLQDGKADFLVNYTVTIEDKTDIRSYNTYNGYSPGFRYGMGVGTYGSGVSIGYSSGASPQVTYYQQGILVIDMVDPNTETLIWRGMADGRLPKNQTQEDISEMVQRVVMKTLSNFPPEANK